MQPCSKRALVCNKREHHIWGTLVHPNSPVSNLKLPLNTNMNYKFVHGYLWHKSKVSVWNLNINNTQSNKEVFSSLEFVKVLLQIEAKLVIMRPHFLRAQNPLLLPFQTPAMQRNRQQLNSYNQRQNQLRHFALKGLFDFSMFQLQMEMSKSQMWLYWLQFWIL